MRACVVDRENARAHHAQQGRGAAKMEITAIIPVFRRPENVDQIIEALRAQTVPVKVVVVNTANAYQGNGADDVWNVPFPVGAYVRFQVAAYYKGLIYYQDDDLLPANPQLLENMGYVVMSRPEFSIVGARARNVNLEPPHYKHDDTRGPFCNNVKGGCMMMHRAGLDLVRTPPADMPARCDDIHVSLEMGRGLPVHVVDPSWEKCIVNLPGFNRGFVSDTAHYDEREAYCKQWLERNYNGRG